MSDNLDQERFDDGDVNIKFSDLYIKKEILGNGAFGTVVAVQSKQDNRPYAVKVLFHSSSNLRSLIRKRSKRKNASTS